MESFRWDKHFITGLLEVDRQHRRLVDLINQFGDHLTENELAFDEIETVLAELSNYAHYHFQDEEGMMSRVGVDPRHVDLHIEQHKSFLRDVASMQVGISPDNPRAASHLLDFLIHWLAFHILGSDQNLARQIESIQSGSSASEAYDAEERRSDSSTEPLLVALRGLFEQVSARNKELRELNQSLEAKVAERTRALSEASLHLEELALTDVLTGVPNRRHAMRRLADLWQESIEAETPLVCIMIDADHFKEVNDSSGHEAGDNVLRELAKALVHTVRSDDIVCRLGGDEFLVICPNTDREGGTHIAELARKAVAEVRVPTGDAVWHGSISAGVAARSSGMENHEALIKVADEGVYAAKRAGRNCVRFVG